MQKSLKGAGIRILSRTFSSPTLADQKKDFLAKFPEAKWHVYEPVNRDNVLEGAKLAFGQPVETRYDFSKADVIVSLDADFLSAGFPGSTKYIRDFAKRRNPEVGEMSRLYVVESGMSATGAKADHRLPLRAADMESFARDLFRLVGQSKEPAEAQGSPFAHTIQSDIVKHLGSSIVVAGDHQPPIVHLLAHLMNQALGNVGKTVFYSDTVDANPINQAESLKELVGDMRARKVDMLVILGGNPVYDSPADFGFADALKNTNIPVRIHHGLYQDETAELCQWHVNDAHYLEAWSDGRAYDGTVSIVQPLIAPLYDGKSAHEILALLSGQSGTSGHDIVKGYWQKQHTADFDKFWRKSLHDGWVEGTAFVPKQVSAKLATAASVASPGGNDLELNFRRDPSIHDGRFANNGWLQELPKPMNKLTWDNAVLISPKTAADKNLKVEDVIEISLNGKKVEGAIWIQAGHPDNSLTVFLGYGRRKAGRVGTGAGFDAYAIRYSATPWTAAGVDIRADRCDLQAGLHAGLSDDGCRLGYASAGADGVAREVPRRAKLRQGRRAAARAYPLQRLRLQLSLMPGAWRLI